MSADPPVVRVWLALILIVSCAVKLAILFAVGEIQPVLDEIQYLTAGQSLSEGRGIEYTLPRWHPTGQGPLYPLFLAGVFSLGGGAFESKIVQVLLSTATVWLAYLLGSRWFGARAGLAAAALLAFDPTLIAFSHYNWSETFYVFWFVLGSLLLFSSDGKISSPRRLFLAGVVIGLAALSRSVFVYLVPLLLPWLHVGAANFGMTARRIALFAAGFALALLPQTVHLYQKYGGLLLVSSGSARVWNESYNVYPPRCSDYGFPPGLQTLGQTPRPAVAEENQVLRVREETRLGLQFAAENPGLCTERFLVREAQYLNPSSFLIRHIRRNYYCVSPDGEVSEPLPDAAREAIVATTVAAYLALMVLALVGLLSIPAGASRSYLLLVLAFFLILHGLSFGMSRYRLGLVPLLAVAAGFALTHKEIVLRRLRTPLRGIAFLLILGLLCYTWSLYLGANLVAQRMNGGSRW